MCGVPIFILTCVPLQNTKLLSWAVPDPLGFPPATRHTSGWRRRRTAAYGLRIKTVDDVLSFCLPGGTQRTRVMW